MTVTPCRRTSLHFDRHLRSHSLMVWSWLPLIAKMGFSLKWKKNKLHVHLNKAPGTILNFFSPFHTLLPHNTVQNPFLPQQELDSHHLTPYLAQATAPTELVWPRPNPQQEKPLPLSSNRHDRMVLSCKGEKATHAHTHTHTHTFHELWQTQWQTVNSAQFQWFPLTNRLWQWVLKWSGHYLHVQY